MSWIYWEFWKLRYSTKNWCEGIDFLKIRRRIQNQHSFLRRYGILFVYLRYVFTSFLSCLKFSMFSNFQMVHFLRGDHIFHQSMKYKIFVILTSHLIWLLRNGLTKYGLPRWDFLKFNGLSFGSRSDQNWVPSDENKKACQIWSLNRVCLALFRGSFP